MIHVIATVSLKPGAREKFLAEFHKLVPLVHAEDGCLVYGPAVDLEAGIPRQIPVRTDVVVVVEQWRDLDALKKHLAAKHMAEYRERVKDYVQGAELQILSPA